MPGASKPKSFASRAQFRAWLGRHHASAAELNLRLSAQERPIGPLARKPAGKKNKAVKSK